MPTTQLEYGQVRIAIACVLASATMAGCPERHGSVIDAAEAAPDGPVEADAAPPDAALPDAALPDAAPPDAQVPDAPPPDAESHSDEAMDSLRRMYEGAAAYYAELAGMPGVIPQVPTASGGFHPDQGSQCGNPEDKFQIYPGMWDWHPWTDLMFSIDEPFYFSVEFRSYGPIPTAFTARASGDLDCDSSYSLFEVYGVVGADGLFPPFELAEKYVENEYE